MPAVGGQWKKLSSNDSRATVFTTVLKRIVHFIQCGSLKIAIVENVGGIMRHWPGNVSFMDSVLATMKAECSTFDWDVVQLLAVDYKLPQERNRVFLRGIRKAISKLPAVLPAFGGHTFETF